MDTFTNEFQFLPDVIVLNNFLSFHKSNRYDSKVSNEYGIKQGNISHAHKHYELYQLLEGDISWIINGKIHRLTLGDVLLIRPNDFHILQVHGNIYYRRVIEFYPPCLNMTLEATNWFLAPFYPKNNAFNNLIPKALIDSSEFNNLFEKFEQTINDTQTSAQFRSMRISVIMAEIFLCLRELLSNNVTVKNHMPTICQDIINYIDKNINKRIFLTDIEKDLHLSRFHLSHEFKKYMGITISSYIIEKKILYAEQLIESGISPTDASIAVAYDYPNFFTNYKKILHKTPRQSFLDAKNKSF